MLAAPRPQRALIYIRGTGPEIDAQLTDALAQCERRGYAVEGVLREQPGATDRWHAAQRMLEAGEADVIVLASARNVPEILESATGTLPGPRQPRPPAGASRHRRVRPLRRGGAA